MIHIILIEPEHPGNIGAVARVMKNFGFDSLYLVSPKCDVSGQECRNRAKHSQDILKRIRIVKKLPRMQTLVATTGILGTDYNVARTPITPLQLSELIKDIDSDIGIVFGREGEGLHNNELRKCDFVCTIPASKDYPTLNLSHAVTILLYELSKNKNSYREIFKPASERDKQQILILLDKAMEKQKYEGEKKKETQRIVWKRMIGKSFLTRREAFSIMGFLKKSP